MSEEAGEVAMPQGRDKRKRSGGGKNWQGWGQRQSERQSTRQQTELHGGREQDLARKDDGRGGRGGGAGRQGGREAGGGREGGRKAWREGDRQMSGKGAERGGSGAGRERSGKGRREEGRGKGRGGGGEGWGGDLKRIKQQ